MSFLPDEKTIKEKRPLFCLPMGLYENMGSRTTETKLLLWGNSEEMQTARGWSKDRQEEPGLSASSLSPWLGKSWTAPGSEHINSSHGLIHFYWHILLLAAKSTLSDGLHEFTKESIISQTLVPNVQNCQGSYHWKQQCWFLTQSKSVHVKVFHRLILPALFSILLKYKPYSFLHWAKKP